jgi:DNA-binding beta-propeller fold protein YncE
MLTIALLPLLFSNQDAPAPLVAEAPLTVPGGPGKFDFMNFDATDRLVFAAHPGRSTFTVINLESRDVKDVDAGCEVNGIDADPVAHKLYAAGPGKTLVQFDTSSWLKNGSLALDGPGDSVIFDPKRNMIYVDNDDGTNLWFVDPAPLKVAQTATIKEAPEVMVLDSGRNKIFQNIKSANAIQVIDLDSHAVVAEYPLGDLQSPHGLAEDTQAGKLFSVGKNGKLVILDADSGKILTTIDVVKSSDQIAYDPGLKRLYIPGAGEIDVVQISDQGASVIGHVANPAGCHSITVDTKTHDVWVVYSDAKDSYGMKLVAQK